MNEAEGLPERVRRHLLSMTGGDGPKRTDASFESLAANWLDKRAMFEDQARLLGMERPAAFPADEARGFVAMTYSGSIVALGPRGTDGGRWFEYAGIELRNDVPKLVRAEGVRLESDAAPDSPLLFGSCPIRKTSDVLAVAACPASVPRQEEEKRLREASVFLTNGFVKINRALTLQDDAVGHFTRKNILRYVARKNGVTQAVAADVVDDFLSAVEAGALMGETVALGSLGRLSLAARAARKARLGRNPATGEEMLIAARPETSVPRLSFSGRFKARASFVPPK